MGVKEEQFKKAGKGCKERKEIEMREGEVIGRRGALPPGWEWIWLDPEVGETEGA